MRFRKKRRNPEVRGTRIITKFAWFPVDIGDTIIWLESYHVLQRYGIFWDGGSWENEYTSGKFEISWRKTS
jgi:hypothetical protein